MTSRLAASLTLLLNLLFSLAAASPARATCQAARSDVAVARLPGPWRVAVDRLICSTAEPGHPWSCAGGSVALTLDATGAMLSVALEGEDPVVRHIASPDDVLPLGQALLAVPLAPLPGDNKPAAPAKSEAPPGPAPGHDREPMTTLPPDKLQPRLLLAAGVDARHVGESRATWVGPVVSAAVPMGRWLPSIALLQQSSVASGRGGLNELSVAVSMQARFELSEVEWRVGLALRAATVERDLPDRQGEQGRLDGRVGATSALVIPLVRWGRLVLSADAEVVVGSHERRAPDARLTEAPRPFPSYTAGGGAMLEVPL